MMWSYNPANGELQRLLTSPYGSEITSSEIYHINNCTIVEAVIQHPYDESDQGALDRPGSTGRHSWLGYLSTVQKKPDDDDKRYKVPTLAPSKKPPTKPTKPVRRDSASDSSLESSSAAAANGTSTEIIAGVSVAVVVLLLLVIGYFYYFYRRNTKSEMVVLGQENIKMDDVFSPEERRGDEGKEKFSNINFYSA